MPPLPIWISTGAASASPLFPAVSPCSPAMGMLLRRLHRPGNFLRHPSSPSSSGQQISSAVRIGQGQRGHRPPTTTPAPNSDWTPEPSHRVALVAPQKTARPRSSTATTGPGRRRPSSELWIQGHMSVTQTQLTCFAAVLGMDCTWSLSSARTGHSHLHRTVSVLVSGVEVRRLPVRR